MKREVGSVGQWYLRRDTRDLFQVVDCDNRSGLVQIQMFDGSIDEVDTDAWRALCPQPVAPPEDWTGPWDSLDAEEIEEFPTDGSVDPQEWFVDEQDPWQHLVMEESRSAEAQTTA
jgi:hypothetical protein